MVFSSMVFLFLFLPLALAIYYVLPNIQSKNMFLLLASLTFYAYGEGRYVLVMVASIVLTWICGLVLDAQRKESNRRVLLLLGVVANMLLLVYFKYAEFLFDILTSFAVNLGFFYQKPTWQPHIHLPLGISFFVFQAISYLVDLYQRKTVCQYNLLLFGMYKSFFPQLIAGPIVRYADIQGQVLGRTFNFFMFAQGVERFIVGLAQKTLIANVTGSLADDIFNAPVTALTWTTAWLGVVAYSLQIYFDFAGYSNMAIGLGRMFGFSFLENFNLPYSAKSVTDFWRRWHMSLSTWFRDYLYIPLGGNRCGKIRQNFNLLMVFFLCGLWHGASWSFVVWGMYHGFFLMLEKVFILNILKKIPVLMRHVYALFLVMIGWVFFRTEHIQDAVLFLSVLFSWKPNVIWQTPVDLSLYSLLDNERMGALALGVFLSLCDTRSVLSEINSFISQRMTFVLSYMHSFSMAVMFLLSLMYVSGSSFNPFIYFRF